MQRRRFLQAMPIVAAVGVLAPNARAQQSDILIAYFSRTGNTRVIANQIKRERNAAIYEIDAATPYPEDYQTTVAQASRETSGGYLPPLKTSVPDLSLFNAIYLGFPIWGMTMPPVVKSFLRSANLSGKTVHPFVTHGGFGIGNSLGVLTSLATEADIKVPFSMEADQERRTLDSVRSWLAA